MHIPGERSQDVPYDVNRTLEHVAKQAKDVLSHRRC